MLTPRLPDALSEAEAFDVIIFLLMLFALLFVVACSKILPWYLARKALHMGTGLLCMIAQMLHLDTLIIVVGLIATGLILTKKLKIAPMQEYALKEGPKATFDVGMLNFCMCTIVPVSMGVSLTHISPVYFADPMGAIVGRNLKTPYIPDGGKKTYGGSVAVMLTAYLSLVVFANATHPNGLLWGFLIAVCEAYSGEWDNAAIATLLSVRYVILTIGRKAVMSTAVYYLAPDFIGCAFSFAASYAIRWLILPTHIMPQLLSLHL